MRALADMLHVRLVFQIPCFDPDSEFLCASVPSLSCSYRGWFLDKRILRQSNSLAAGEFTVEFLSSHLQQRIFESRFLSPFEASTAHHLTQSTNRLTVKIRFVRESLGWRHTESKIVAVFRPRVSSASYTISVSFAHALCRGTSVTKKSVLEIKDGNNNCNLHRKTAQCTREDGGIESWKTPTQCTIRTNGQTVRQ